MNGPGMWMPKQKAGKNWQVEFTVTALHNNETVSRTKTFRIRANAYEWINRVKQLTIEVNEVKEPEFSSFTYKVSKIGGSLEKIKSTT